MKRVSLIAGALIALGAMAFTSTASLAQAPAPQPPAKAAKAGKGEHGKLAKVLKQLNLTDQQKADLKPILMDQRTQAKAIREDSKLTPEQKKEKMKDLMKATHEKIAAILTPEQKAKLKELRRNHEHKGGTATTPTTPAAPKP
jgi:periplasmic protein CpxP/Spy